MIYSYSFAFNNYYWSNKKPNTMNPLKIVLTFMFAVFFTVGLLANQTFESGLETNEQIEPNKLPKVSAAQAISLFNFFKVETVDADSSDSGNKISESKLNAYFDYFISLARPVIY